MKKALHPQKTIWAVDPFERKNETRAQVLKEIRELAKQGATIQPVHVLNPEECNIEVGFDSRWIKAFEPYSQKAMETYLKDIQGIEFAEPKTLIERGASTSLSVRALLSYAARAKADSLIVGTHARAGVSRLFLGSFAETLLLHSRIPVLVVGPSSSIQPGKRKKERIIFSTDFGPASFSAFRKVLAMAKARNAEITLFHCLPNLFEPFLQSSAFLLAGGYLALPQHLTESEAKKRKEAVRYVKEGAKLGIPVNVQFYPGQGSTARSIVERAKKEKADLIAMLAQRGPISAAVVGSITRQVVRSAPCPVWVLRAP